jgi:hypothetical protein
VLIDEHPRENVDVLKYRTHRSRGGENYVDWFVLRIGDQTMKFTFSDRWTDRGAMAVRALGYRGPTHHGWESQ